MTPTEIHNFIRAGRAVFTLQSTRTGTHFTYRIAQGEQRGPALAPYFASVLTAPDCFTYIGMISGGSLVVAARSSVSACAPSFKALAWFLRQLERGSLPESLIFRHEGRCGRCGRPLTTPASVDTGLGPDCAEALGVAHEAHAIRAAAKPFTFAPHEAREYIRGPKDAALCAALPSRVHGGPSLQQVLAESRAAYGSGYSDGED
jgi:uncharacterized protein DUF6011